MSRSLELTQGQKTWVDDEDFEFLSQWKWQAQRDPHVRGFYASRKTRVAEHGPGGQPCLVLMHRVVAERMGLEIAGLEVDHIDRLATLDNRRSNLRAATRSQSMANRSSFRNSSSPFKGVHRHEATGKWVAEIQTNSQRHRLGYFDSEVLAAIAYNRAAVIHHGEFAGLNQFSIIPSISEYLHGVR